MRATPRSGRAWAPTVAVHRVGSSSGGRCSQLLSSMAPSSSSALLTSRSVSTGFSRRGTSICLVHPSSSSTSIFSTSNRAFVTHTLDRSASVDAQFLHHTKNIAAKTPGESWRAFLVYLASLRRLDLAFALLDDLEHHDQATPSVYLSFLSACAQVVHQEADMRAQEIISRMQARGLSTPLILLHETTLHASAHLSSFIFLSLSLYTLTHTTYSSQNLARRTTRRCCPRPPVQPESRPRSRR